MSAPISCPSHGIKNKKIQILCQEIEKVNLFSQAPKTVTIEVGRSGFEVFKPRDSILDSRSTSLGTNSDQLSKRKPSKASKDPQQSQHRKSSSFHPPAGHHHRPHEVKRRILVDSENYEVVRSISSILKEPTKGSAEVRKLDKYTSTDNGAVVAGKNQASQTEDVLLVESGADPYAILDF